jgi:DNA polymerase I-like protein with 3'-5' exonuclease and polymerase domains
MVDVLKEGYSFLPQSTASDLCLSAAIELDRLNLPLRNIVHDSILAEVVPEMADETAALMTSTMERVALEKLGDYVTFKADVKIGKNWGDV